jgi:hypothetical protein
MEGLGAAFLEARASLNLDDLEWHSARPGLSHSMLAGVLSRCRGEVGFRAAAERLGRGCEEMVRSFRGRGETGSYYTPRWIADEVARTAIDGVLAGRGAGPRDALSIKVLDPAVGAGAFAIAVVEAIARGVGEDDGGNDVRRAAVRDCLFGIELDPLAAEACRLSVWLAASRPGRPAALPPHHITVGDALGARLQQRSFDVVVGNPPWGVKLSQERALELAREAGEALSGHRDSYLFFLHLAGRCARDDGTVGMLLPDAVLSQARCQGLRRWLLERFRLLRVVLLGGSVFAGATAPGCILCLAGRGVAPPVYETADVRRVARGRLREEVSRPGLTTPGEAPLSAPQYSFVIAPEWLRLMLDRLRADSPSLADLSDVFRFHDVGINYPTAAAGRAILYPGCREDARDIPVARGRDFGPFTPIGHSMWLRHDWHERVRSTAGVSVRDGIYRQAPKLLFRQTGDRPVATVDQQGVWFGRSVIAITAGEESDLLWLAAFFNSRAWAALYRAVSPEAGRSFAQVKVNKLKLLPVPPTSRGGDLCRLARAMLEEASPAVRAALLEKIDAAVYGAYQLSPEEIRRLEATVPPAFTSAAGGARPRRRRRGAT